MTDTRGSYVFDQLPPGEYTVSVRKAGFPGYSATGIVLEVNQKARHDVRLTVGTGQEQITVTAAVSPLNTDDAAIGYRMDNSKILDLPLPVAQCGLAGDARPGRGSAAAWAASCTTSTTTCRRARAARSRSIRRSTAAAPRMNTFLLDGAYDTDRNTFAIAVYPPIDSVQEFHIQSSLAPAEFPQSGGGAIDVVTKSGTRQLPRQRLRVSAQ